MIGCVLELPVSFESNFLSCERVREMEGDSRGLTFAKCVFNMLS